MERYKTEAEYEAAVKAQHLENQRLWKEWKAAVGNGEHRQRVEAAKQAFRAGARRICEILRRKPV
jgi:hypothetical protein